MTPAKAIATLAYLYGEALDRYDDATARLAYRFKPVRAVYAYRGLRKPRYTRRDAWTLTRNSVWPRHDGDTLKQG